ncbi:MAG: pyridoxamine 5'-phosphate oxidase family protein [Epsilonproteobacteria bacterium]|nr:pyridoxamine 5'-phosphate oxidase family protein [Campylobacterota bacterium]
MSDKLQKIEAFIAQHHVMSLATSYLDNVSVCSVFYVYDADKQSFIFASDKESLHVINALKNNYVAANILLETDEVGKIQGLQARGIFQKTDKTDAKLYYKRFPYALAMQPSLWKMEVDFFKLTDNRLGFGKKLIWP